MNDTYLIQRLEKPYEKSDILAGVDNPFSFGGGLKNGGLSDTAMNLLRNIFSFDYMGAAEYEFGAVPKALSQIAKAENLISGSLSFKESDVAKRDSWGKTRRPLLLAKDATVWYICPADFERDVIAVICKVAKNTLHLKAGANLHYTLRPDSESPSRVEGWLELDNGFFFFTDYEMFEKVATLFGVEV